MASPIGGGCPALIGPAGGLLLLLGGWACDSPFSLIERSTIAQARSRWEARDFVDYRFEIRRSCFCAPDLTQWARVTVRDGRVAGVELLETPGTVPQAEWSYWPTIESLFASIVSIDDRSSISDVSVTFDPTLGYPTRIVWEPEEGVLDAGGLDELRNAEAAPGR